MLFLKAFSQVSPALTSVQAGLILFSPDTALTSVQSGFLWTIPVLYISLPVLTPASSRPWTFLVQTTLTSV